VYLIQHLSGRLLQSGGREYSPRIDGTESKDYGVDIANIIGTSN